MRESNRNEARESVRRIGAIASRIISQFRRDPRTIALILVAPVLVLALMGFVMTEKKTPVTIGVVDLDQAQRLGPVLERLLVEKDLTLESYGSTEAMLQRMRDGFLRGGVIIPADFTGNALAGKGLGGVRLVVEGSDAMLSADIARRFGLAFQALPQAIASEVGAAPPPSGAPKVDYVYGGPALGTLSYFAPGFVVFFAFFFTFLLTSVSFLRERSSGTMERLLASPVRKGEIVVGYLLGFGFFALLQSLVILLFTVFVLGVTIAGSLGAAFVVVGALVSVAVVLGIFCSFYARNELQVIQFIPLVIIPQIVLSGFITPLETMYQPLRSLAMAMPMTYANNALRAIFIRGWGLDTVLRDLGILAGFVVLFTVLAARLIKRHVA